MNTEIDKMSEGEIVTHVWGILGCPIYTRGSLIGFIIEKLQEWECAIAFGLIFGKDGKEWHVYHAGRFDLADTSLQRCFLKTAESLGKWSPPAPPPSLEERVTILEERLHNRDIYGKLI